MAAPFLLLWHPRVQTQADVTTVYLDLQPITTVETAQFSDSATVYLDLQPISTFLDVPYILEIISATSRWTVSSLGLRYGLSQAVARMSIVATITRWAIMETRRFLWKR